jgi:PAS domain S-box-containing protein
MNTQSVTSKFSAESILQAFMAGTHDAYLVLDDAYNVVSFNERYAAFHEDFFGEKIYKGHGYLSLLKTGQFKQLFSSIYELSSKKQVIKFTCNAIKIQSHLNHWFDFELHPLKNNNGLVTGIGIGIFDTTETHAAAEKIKKSEELFKALVINSTDAFQLTDAELKVSYVSESVKSILGYDKEALIGAHFFNLIHPDDKVTISTWLHWLMHHPGVVKSVEVRIKNERGDWIYIEINGNNMIGVDKIDAIVMNYRDIQAKKVADKALALAEQRMGLLLNNTKESFIIVNSRLRVVTYNRAAQEHSPFFFTQELQSGISLLDLIREGDIEDIIYTFEQVFDGSESERETSFTDEFGILHVYNHSFRPLFSDDDIVGVFITSTNITEKKKAELQLKAREERNRTIIQESFDAMIIKDQNNLIMEASPAVQKIVGFSPDEIVGKECYDFLHEDYVDKMHELIDFIMEEPDREASLDALIQHKNGEYVWVEMKAKNMHHNKLINGAIVMLRDISVRKQAEEVVSLSEQRFKGLVQSGADMISIIDEEGYVKYSSPTVTKILGNNPENDIGRNVFHYIHPNDLPGTKDAFDQMLRNGTRQMSFGPYRFPNSNRDYRWLETVVTNLSDDPAIKGIVINSRDVTETKRLNEEQQQLTEELIKNNQDLQQFSFITSHNLRAPVANLISLLNLYDKENVEEPFNKVLIEKFEEASQQLNDTLNDLLEVLVLKSNTDISIEPLSLNSITDQVNRNIENLLKEQNGAIAANFSEVDMVVYNKLHLESIFQNIISNAIKYRSPNRNPFIQITSYFEDKWIVIAFKDNGIGIDLSRYKDRIFGMYQRFHAGKEGKGLGLYMIKAQVMAMGGKIEVESELHESTTFKVYLKNNGKV